MIVVFDSNNDKIEDNKGINKRNRFNNTRMIYKKYF